MSKTLLTVWGVGESEPIAHTCEVFGYPNRTTSGETMYENTFFMERADAWDAVRSNLEAREGEALSRLLQAQSEVDAATRKIVQVARARVAYTDARARDGEVPRG